MITSEDANRLRTLARLHHRTYRGRADRSPRGEPLVIGRVAAKIARAHFRHAFAGDAASRELLVDCAGNLVYAMDCYGLGFEAICDMAEIGVAQVVAGLSPDISLPHGLRVQHARSKLLEARIESQIVRLAELYCAAKLVKERYTLEDLRVHAETLRLWYEDASTLLESLHKVRASHATEVRSVLAQTHELIVWVGKAAVNVSRGPAAVRDAIASGLLPPGPLDAFACPGEAAGIAEDEGEGEDPDADDARGVDMEAA